VIAFLRHELRTPINLIVGYSEMLREDCLGPELDLRRSHLDAVLGTVREILHRVDATLAPTLTELDATDLDALLAWMSGPQRTIVNAVEALRADSPLNDDGFTTDVEKIRTATEQLLAVRVPAHASNRVFAETPARGNRIGSLLATTLGSPGGAQPLILVADDMEDNRNVLERRLRRDGCAVDCAEDGIQALEMIAARSYDLVLLDIMMPGLDGIAVLERLKSSPATRDIPVLMISALDDLDSVVRCIETGADDYLPKPFDAVLLRARIGACLEKKRLRDVEAEYLKQVERVTSAAAAVEDGAYVRGALDDIGQRQDALGRLARVFASMVDSVRAREERLREQLSALQGEMQAAAGSATPAIESETWWRPGQIVANRYEILEVIGSGGMGVVYGAHDRELNEQIAIKALRTPLFDGDAEDIERFKTEIRLTRRISHPNVVRTHDFGVSDGVYFVTMERVEGMTLRTLLARRGTLTVSATVAIASQLARALEVAHSVGVVHRDIKPENILLDTGGTLKVMDFGIAKVTEMAVSRRTEVGMLVGTPAYMAPEQLLEEHIDGRSDLYATGVVLYECLTGDLPFIASSPMSLIAKVLTGHVSPPHVGNASVSPAASHLVLRLLSRAPADRPASATELCELLARLD